MTRTIYYLPGHGGLLSTGLGVGLRCRGFAVAGRETVGEFRSLTFSEQIGLIAEDIQSTFWHEDCHIVANSFGAYLFLNAQTMMSPYIGKLLLLSPIVGEFSNQETRMGFIPPQAGRISRLAQCGNYPTPRNCEIHVGANDWQSDPKSVVAFADQIGLSVTVVPNAGHMLGERYVSSILDGWLPKF
jgi:alpha-beta hydrolase superfamily lysophospholipase